MRISSRLLRWFGMAGGLVASVGLLWFGIQKGFNDSDESPASASASALVGVSAPVAATSGAAVSSPNTPAPSAVGVSSVVPLFSLEPQDITSDAASSNPALAPLPYYKRMRGARLEAGDRILPPRPETAIGVRWFFDLFPDVQWTGVVKRVEVLGDDRAVFYGVLEGVEGSDFIVAYEGGVIAASFTSPGLGMYQIRYGGDGLQTIIELDPAKLPTCALDAEQQLASGLGRSEEEARLARQQAALLKQVATDIPASVQSVSASAEEPQAAAGEGAISGVDYGAFGQQGGSETGLTFTTVDMLVVYTGAAQTGAGGVAGMNTLIDLCVARANASFINSRVGVRLRLVRRESVSYTEPGNISTDLDRLSYVAGSAKDPTGYLDSVLTTRDSVGADLVCMLTETTGSSTSGLAWLYNGGSSWGISVVKRSGCESTFAHEVGHNFGCGHDRENTSGTPLYSYAYGSRFTPEGYAQLRTIMAYSPGQQVPYYSNPDVTYLGAATGVAIGSAGESNNAQVMENTKAGVAAFRSTAGNTPPTVALTSPTYSDSLAALDSLTLAATATDGDAGDSVTAVRFYQLMDDDVWAFTNYSSTLLGTDTTAPYTNSVSSLKAGFVTYAAVAEDSHGGIATHTVSVTVNPWYKLTRLPMPVGYTASLDITGMNTSGQIAGNVTNGSGLYQACRWDTSTANLLGFLPGDTQSKAHAITDAGLVYGESISAGGIRRACRWAANGAITDISTLISGETATSARGDDGAGRVLLETGSDTRYYLYASDGSTALPLNFKGTAISSGGYIGGYDYNFSSSPNRWEAARWTASGSSAALLPPLEGYTSAWGWNVNRSGAVAGICSPTSGWSTANSRATFWTAPTRFNPSATPTDLGTLSSTASYASALNDQGDVVGNYTDALSVDRPFIWNSTNGIVDLNHLLAPCQQLLVQYPESISPVGSIAAEAWNYSTSSYIPVRIEPLAGLYHDYWLRKYFTAVQVEAVGTAGDMDDPDGDGLPNLIERAFGMNPTTAAPATAGSGYPVASIEPVSTKVTLQFRRLRQPSDLVYQVETSSTLASDSWSTAGAEVEQVTVVDGEWEDVTYRSATAPAAGAPVFMRVRVTHP